MTPQELLNADVRTIWRWLRQGFAWWGRELSEMLPERLRRRQPRRARLVAKMIIPPGSGWLGPSAASALEAASIQLWRDGAPCGPADSAGRGVRAVDLIVPPDAVLVREVELPRLSSGDLHRLVTLNLDRYTPFTADQVYFDTAPLGRDAAKGDDQKQRVALGVLKKAWGQAMAARAAALGLKVERLGIGGGADGLDLQFDFMRALRDETDGADPLGRRRLWLGLACAVLIVVNVGIAVLRDMNDVGQLQRLVDAQQPTVALALRLRKTVETERARRIALLTRRSVHEPLRILDAVTRALPSGQWVQRLEWNGRVVRLVGFKTSNFDVLAALSGPALTHTRSLLSDMVVKTPTGATPFDIMADATAHAPSVPALYDPATRPPGASSATQPSSAPVSDSLSSGARAAGGQGRTTDDASTMGAPR